ncbi:unnamed protein product [Ostreobium quekettii]|uniref:GIY-YIG domain-containing protein n=1 Tax=Ostreobium quekettii TaxID=121088 RepID=A0A8S1JIT8_9CHLO|nr:unnamed protein product [Ostreobium quekettii]|eukprot:evm.model.scf_2225.1 EVM.evm.TU.scf_2225.1   scf_2225:575-9780(+)
MGRHSDLVGWWSQCPALGQTIGGVARGWPVRYATRLRPLVAQRRGRGSRRGKSDGPRAGRAVRRTVPSMLASRVLRARLSTMLRGSAVEIELGGRAAWGARFRAFRTSELLRWRGMGAGLPNWAQQCAVIGSGRWGDHWIESPLRRKYAWTPPRKIFAAASRSQNYRLSPEDVSFWNKILSKVTLPNASQLVDQLDMTASPTGVVLAGRRRRPSCYDFFCKVKAQYPRHVVLCRIGEFYESLGVDAVLLVEHAGLNPMSPALGVPKAGCPVVNIRKTLESLVQQAGFSAVVCEEAPAASQYGRTTGKKDRYVSGVVTPSMPMYLHGLIDSVADELFNQAAPVLGVALTSLGFTVMDVTVDSRMVKVSDGLTEEAMWSRIYAQGVAPPLYVHSSISAVQTRRARQGTDLSEWEYRLRQIAPSQVGHIEIYTSPSPLDGLLMMVRRSQGLPPDVAFQVVSEQDRSRPMPLYLSTSSQLGITQTRGFPSLLDFVLPAEATGLVRGWMNKLLLMPPTDETAQQIHAACELLANLRCPIPSYGASMPSSKVVQLISAAQGNVGFFRNLRDLVNGVHETILAPELVPLAKAVTAVTEADTRLALSLESLEDACVTAIKAISGVVAPASSEGDVEVEAASGDMAVVSAFFAFNEGKFQGRVLDRCLKTELEAVREAQADVEGAVEEIFLPLRDHSRDTGNRRRDPIVAFDRDDNSVFLKIASPVLRKSEFVKNMALLHPFDRKSVVCQNRYSSERLELALSSYREACSAAEVAVRKGLISLAESLRPILSRLIGAAQFVTIMTALQGHVREACRRNWALPDISVRRVAEPGPMVVEEMWPYWLDGLSMRTVRNTFELSGMVMLTGPNMAGKSTVLRSVCAVALLGSCGLFIPATFAKIPYIDAFVLRTFASDSPIDGRSGFATEMWEMGYVLDDVSTKSLVLVDELGKGTEVHAGTAVAGAIFESIRDKGCMGIFATHLHFLFRLPLVETNIRYMKMETVKAEENEHGPGNGFERREPTWKIVPGKSTESLALQVAEDSGLPDKTIQRASQLLDILCTKSLTGVQQPRTTDRGGLEGMEQTMLGACRNHGDGAASWPQSVDPGAPQLQEADITGRLVNKTEANGGDSVSQPSAGAETLERGIQSLNRFRCSPAGQPADGEGERMHVWAGRRVSNVEEGLVMEVFEDCARKAWQALASTSSVSPQDGAANGTMEKAGGSAAECDSTLVSPSMAGSEGQVFKEGWEDGNHSWIQSFYVPPGHDPPPRLTNRACIYVVRWADEYLYVGETDDLQKRLRHHRRRRGSAVGKALEAWYICVPRVEGSKSMARAIEKETIRGLGERGWPLWSSKDGRNANFGVKE